MEALEARNLLSLSLSILTGVEGESVAARIQSNADPDVIYAIYDPATDRVTINPAGVAGVVGPEIVLDPSIRTVMIEAGEGDDVVHVRGGGIQYVVNGGPGNDRLTGSNGPDWIEGGPGNDWLSGALGADYLAGGLGDDSLVGGSGNDVLVGGEGADELWGGRGRDTSYFDNFDLVTLAEVLIAADDLDGATPPQTIDPNEIVTPPCPPECPAGWDGL